MAVGPKARQVIKAGFGAGGGLLYFFKPSRARSTGVRLTKGNFSEVTFRRVAESAVDLNAATSGVNIGLAWFPLKPQWAPEALAYEPVDVGRCAARISRLEIRVVPRLHVG